MLLQYFFLKNYTESKSNKSTGEKKLCKFISHENPLYLSITNAHIYFISCLSIFYINLAKTSFLTEDYKEMKEYLYKAKNISKEFDSYWEGPVIDSYFAMSMFIEGKYLETIEYLKSANKELNTINNPRDFGIIYFIETLIRIEIEKKENEKYIKL